MRVLLSIKPEFAARIFQGEKRFEFRKSAFKDDRVKIVVVYVTSPVCKIVGEFDVVEILSDEPSRLWSRTKEYAGISEAFFWDYFSGRTRAVALAIGDVREYSRPINPSKLIANFTAPQSYMYLDDQLQPARRVSEQYSLAI
ncbi:ASCH domain-containing protein [Rhodopseudomonas palustris]|uniref:ASCH domain-containing protein n=1 Tax=Rhodopseudomonas palustris TaxID=1076 RepID=A0A418V310_RHOPL|nr:ASCH domain-containing protein [Rhodopseudomonas palustris]RJF70456.1 ASCH domain-containing protein [Rhodopseudomonas palustris]